MGKICAGLGLGLFTLLFMSAIGANPRYIEELAVGGGITDPVDGGADFTRDGSIETTGKVTVGASTTARAGMNIPHGTPPASPVNGDIWTTTAGVFARVNGATNGPFLTSSTIPWHSPGPIGATAPNSGSFTTGTFSGDIRLSGATANIDANGAATQFQLFHTKSTGNASIRLQPVPQDGAGQAFVDLFRSTNTSGYVGLLVRKGDNTSTSIFEVKSGNTPSTYFRNSGGSSKLDIDHNTGNLSSAGDATHRGGDIVAGDASVTRGVITLWDGAGDAAPGCVKIASPNGTLWYLFVEDDGTVKVSSSLPTANTDGLVVGSQF